MASNYPLMKNNISREDLDLVIKHLKKRNPILTQNKFVKKFESEWSKWLGVKHSIFVNSGSSANLLAISYLKTLFPKGGEVIVPSLTWSSDINSLLFFGFKPIFADCEMKNLSISNSTIEHLITKKTVAIFITYAQGFNSMSNELINLIKKHNLILIEDVCESHGATFKNKKLGSFGLISNFSFYYAHHMSTIEGGMICTNNSKVDNYIRMARGHGLLRESNDERFKNLMKRKYLKLNSEFIFMINGFNMRNNEIGGLLGCNQLKRLDINISKRNVNFKYFLSQLNKEIFFCDFDTTGMSNYAFNLILKKEYKHLINKLCKKLDKNKIEYRLGSAGGGNQIRQPYVNKIFSKNISESYLHKNYPNVEHIHKYGMYIGNYPELSKKDIDYICKIINSIE